MSDSPELVASDAPDGAQLEQADAVALRDVRWLTGVIWVGLLVALLVTSVYAINSSGIGSVITRYFSLPANSTAADMGEVAKISAVASLGMSALAALAVVGGWLAFARVTKAVVMAFADASDQTPTAAEWLIAPEEEASEALLARTLASDVSCSLRRHGL
jgi:hypothetical protein